MDEVTVLHNPRCSKSRGAIEILTERGAEFEVIEYLEAPPDRAMLERILSAIPDRPSALVRRDKRFDELGLDPDAYETPEAVIEVLLAHPELMERPVVVRGGRAVIARPSEKVLELFEG